MRSLIAAFCMLGTAIPANAISHKAASARMATSRMTCAQVQEGISKEGAVVVTYGSSSRSSMPQYGRYVNGSHYCSHNEVLVPMSIPTADTKSCRVMHCVNSR